MIRRTSGAFRTNAGSVGTRLNMSDDTYANTVTNNEAQYTAGSTIVDRIPALFPPTAEDCEVLSFTVGARLAMPINPGNDNTQTFGRLGKLVAGITTELQPTSGIGSVGYAQNLLPLPNDLTLIGDLWNPAVDDLPPMYAATATGDNNPIAGGANPQGLQVGMSQTLPTPVPVPRGINLCIAMWKLPSIISSNSVGQMQLRFLVLDATWSLVYEDGQR